MHHRQDAHQKGSDNSASARVSNQFQSRPFGLQAQSETTTPQQQETPDLQTQLERAKRFGPDFSRVRVRAEGPPPTIQSKLFFGEQRDQEEPVTDAIANPLRSMPAPRVNLPPIQRQDAELVRMEPNPLAARMMPVVQRRDAEWVGNQPNPLAARMMPPIPRQDAESVGNRPNPLAARMMPVVQRQPQPIVSIPRQSWIQRIEQQPEAKLEQEDESAPVQAKLENATVQRQSEANEEEEAEDSLPVQTQLEKATVQRQSEGEQESEKEDHSMQLVQPKLTVGAPGDKYEIEADSMAERVMSMNVPADPAAIQRSEVGEEDPLQRSPLATSITPLIQRQSEEGEDIQTKPSVQRAGRDGGVQRRSSIENTLASQKGGGSPLDEDVRSFMEPRFGNDFSGVRIHTGSNAVSMNKELHAQAFTHGSDVYFNEGKYNPGSNEGKQLLAHELTHVVQQTGAKKLQRKSIASLRSNKETLQAKISSASSAAIQLKESPGSPQADPAFQAVVKRTEAEAAKQKAHPPAKKKSDEAQAAAQPPANEVESKAQDKQVQEMNQQQPGKFSAEAFKAALKQKIEAATPQTLEEADKFKDNNRLDSVKGEASSKVTQEKKQASGPIEEKAKQPPNPSGITPKPVTPLPPKEAGSKPGDINPQGAAPKPKDAAEVSLEAESKKLDQQMAEANVTEEQLAKSNEPEFQGALKSKKDAQTNAVTAPQEYRQKEQATLTQAQAQAQTTAQTQLEGMHGGKEQLLAQVLGKQGEAKGQDEQKRAEVASKINGFYEKTKSDVETLLNNLDKDVIGKFDAGAAAAKQKFETFVAPHMETYKQRYDGLFGAGRWVADKLLGVPPEVSAFFTEGRQLYLTEMDKTINEIANHVATQLNQAKQKIADGKQQIQDYVGKLPENLRQVGQEAAQNIQGKFDDLESSVDNKQNQLVDSLAQKYSENLQQLDAQLAEMKASNRTWMDAALDAVGGAIKTIVELKNLLMGVLAKAAGAIDKIILDPIAFLGNLVAGVKQGFMNFSGNIAQHLQKGLMGWLTGAIAGAGITMPENFDLKGIFHLVMQVLGVVYEAIKSRTVKALGKNGEKIFNALETSFEMFVILKNEGIAGLWQFIQDKIGDLQVMVIDTIKTFVIENVIKAGVMWVISLLNPASAFVKACKAIYDIIMFFIERGSQIAELVNAVMESVSAIAGGAIGGAASLIENALGKALPVVISFMASLLGLGGISEKIQEIIQKVRQPIEKAIDWVIAQAVKFAKKLGNKLGFGKDKKKGNKESAQEGQALNLPEVAFKDAAGENHRLWLQKNGNLFQLMVASGKPTNVEDAVKKDGEFEDIEGQQETQVVSTTKQIEKLAQASDEQEKSNSDQEIKSQINKVATDLAQSGNQNLEGALAAYRGIHFQVSWDEEKYQNQVNKTASDIIGQPEFSKATYEVAKSLFGKEEFTTEELESAAEIVRQDLETLKEVEAKELSTNPDKLDKDAQKQAYRRLIKRGVTEPTSEQVNQEIEAVKQEMLSPGSRYMHPIMRGSEGKGTKRGFENMFYVAIHQYINNKKQFEADLQNVATGRYRGLKFTKVPFLSTSKVAKEAAKYAFGKAQDSKDIRTEGTVGRVFVYVFSVEEQAKKGLLNIERLHKENKISRSDWLINEAEVAFTGSIPGENLIGYHDAQTSQTPETVGTLAEQTARNKAATMGGLREWDT